MISTTDSRDGETDQVLVVGSDAVGARVARTLPAETTFVGFDQRVVDRVGDAVDESVVADPRQFDVPDRQADTAVVTTPTDRLKLLYERRLRAVDGVSTVPVRLGDPQYREVFDSLGVETVCETTPVSESLCDSYSRSVVQHG